jgi:ATP-dependent protease ClpP protease subunit
MNIDEDSIETVSATKHGYRKVAGNYYEFYLSGTITAPEDYVEWFNVIRNASSADTVKIYINSRGGDADTAIQFMRVLGETDAHVICSIEGSCMSAATMVFLCGLEFEITPHSLFMVHNYSSGIFGKGAEIYDQAVFERKWSTEFMKHIYKDFLNDKEIDLLLDGKDMWMTSSEVLERCTEMAKARAYEAKAQEELEEDDEE